MVHAAVYCHMGRGRKNNEDNFYLNGFWKPQERTNQNCLEGKSVPPPALFAVLDGMGGEQYGEVASATAAALLHKHRDVFLTGPDPEDAGAERISQLSRALWKSCKESGYRMGTTLAVAAIRDHALYLFGLGDSRIYLLENGKLTQATQDHTVAAETAYNTLSGERARSSKDAHSNQLTQYFGMDCSEYDAAPCHGHYPLRQGMKILLCSDGLYNTLEEVEMADLLAQSIPVVAVQRLVDLALDRGAKDNITAMILAI